MLTAEQNRFFVEVGPDKPMGKLLRRYWIPFAGASELDEAATKPVRLLCEDLIAFPDETVYDSSPPILFLNFPYHY